MSSLGRSKRCERATTMPAIQLFAGRTSMDSGLRVIHRLRVPVARRMVTEENEIPECTCLYCTTVQFDGGFRDSH
jgi:hypothetical protein